MKKLSILYLLTLIITQSYSQGDSWKIVKDKITSPWADSVNPASVFPDYPRPQLAKSRMAKS